MTAILDPRAAEPCTTESARKQHWSADLCPLAVALGGAVKGRSGRTLCGQNAKDETNINYRRRQWHAAPVDVASLPPCRPCAKRAGITIPEPERPLWRFDVPEVPARITAVEDAVGWTWVREGAVWVLWRGTPGAGVYRISGRDLIGRLPLVECPDPRAAQEAP